MNYSIRKSVEAIHHSALARHNSPAVRLGSHRDKGKTRTPSFRHVNFLHFPLIYPPFLAVVVVLFLSPNVDLGAVVAAGIPILRAKTPTH